ncbi:MAG TPA: glycosyltransferase [Paenirhodobacter sp.]
MRGLSCVIPAYNEAPRIAAVLQSVIGHPAIDEVIVVDDGSSDATAEIVAGIAGARLIRMAQNAGKSRAVATGIEAAQGDLILLLDSDLIGLSGADLNALIAPVRAGRADVAISLRGNAPGLWRAIGLDYISGERVVSKALLGPIEALRRLPRFGLEVYMNRRILAAGARIAVVRWPGVASPWKAAKRGRLAGVKADLKMLSDMFHTITPVQAVAQIWAMRRLRA